MASFFDQAGKTVVSGFNTATNAIAHPLQTVQDIGRAEVQRSGGADKQSALMQNWANSQKSQAGKNPDLADGGRNSRNAEQINEQASEGDTASKHVQDAGAITGGAMLAGGALGAGKALAGAGAGKALSKGVKSAGNATGKLLSGLGSVASAVSGAGDSGRTEAGTFSANDKGVIK